MGILRSRLAVGVAALVIGAGAASAVTYAVADEPATPDTFYACKTSTGKIRAGTIRTATPPTCRADRGETVAQWQSAPGGVSIDDLIGATCNAGPAAGTLEVAFAPGSGNISMQCEPAGRVDIQIRVEGAGSEWAVVGGTSLASCRLVCSIEVNYGTAVQFGVEAIDTFPGTATPRASVVGWTGNAACTPQGCEFQATTDVTLVVTLDELSVGPVATLSIWNGMEADNCCNILNPISPADNGVSVSGDEGTPCQFVTTVRYDDEDHYCTYEVPTGVPVTLTMVPGALWGPGTWYVSGAGDIDCPVHSLNCTFVAWGDVYVRPQFVSSYIEIYTSSQDDVGTGRVMTPYGSVTSYRDVNVEPGAVIRLEALPDAGSRFVAWTDSACTGSSDPVCEVTVPLGSVLYAVALFAADA